MIDYTLQAMGLIITAVIFWRAESVLNLMAKECWMLIRLAFWCMVVGAFSIGLAIVQGWVPPMAVLLTLSGTALLLVTERRIGTILRIRNPANSRQNRRSH